MNKNEYYVNFYGIYDTVAEEVITTGWANNCGQYARQMIPIIAKQKPLNDIKIMEIGEICIGNGAIRVNQNRKLIDWKDCYKFEVTNEAVENESKTSEKTDKE